MHVQNRANCPTNTLCCNPSTDYLNINSICAIKGISFKRNSWVNPFEGLIVLNETNQPTLMISNLTITNFHATLNYNSFIFDNSSNGTILINSVSMTNVYFTKGLFVIDAVNINQTKNFNFNLQGLMIDQWNPYKVLFDVGVNKLFGSTQIEKFVLGYNGVLNVSLTNITITNSNVGYVFPFKNAWITMNGLSVNGFCGTVFYLVSSIQTDVYNVRIVNSSYDGKSWRDVSTYNGQPVIADSASGRISITNLTSFNINGTGLFLTTSFLRITNAVIASFLIPLSLNNQGIFIDGAADYNDFIIDNLHMSTISKLRIFALSQRYRDIQFILKNSVFENIDSLTTFLMVHNITIQNVVFRNLTLNGALLLGSPFRKTGQIINLYVQSCYFVSVFAPILRSSSVAGPNNYFFNDSILESALSLSNYFDNNGGYSNFNFKNNTFNNFSLQSGYFISTTLITDTVTFINNTFNTFNFLSASTNGLISMTNTKTLIDGCVFKKFNYILTGGNLINVVGANFTLNNSIFEDIFIGGSGGFTASQGSLMSNITMNNLSFRNTLNSDSGFFNLAFIANIFVTSVSFYNISSFKYTLFSFKNSLNLTFVSCSFTNIKVSYGYGVFFLTTQNSQIDNFSKAVFENNIFQQLFVDTFNGAGITFQNYILPVYIINNTFSESMALEGGFIFTYLSGNIYITNCVFQFATTMQDGVGAALWMNQVKYLEIKDCLFSQNNAKYGNASNIYLQDSKILVQNTYFTNSQSMFGSAIYAYYTKDFIASFDTFVIIQCNFSNLTQISGVIIIHSMNILQITLEDLSFSDINSLNGDGVLSCDLCVGSLNNFDISNSELSNAGAMISITHSNSASNLLTNITLNNFNVFNNDLNANFVFLQNINYINISDWKSSENRLKSSFLKISYFSDLYVINLIVIDNTIISQQTNNAYLGQLQNGNNICINQTNVINTISSFFYISDLNELVMQNINIANITNSDLFAIIQNIVQISFQNWLITKSYLNSINIFINNAIVQDLYFEDINQIDNIPLIYFSSTNGLGNLILNDTIIKRSVNGIQIVGLMSAEIQGYTFDNTNFLKNSFSALSFVSVLNAIIINSKINLVSNAAGITITKYNNTIKGIISLNESSISNCGSDTTQTGGLSVTGNSDITIKQCVFDSNKGFLGSAFSLDSNNDPSISIMKFDETQFLNHQTGFISVPNNTYYSLFQANQSDFMKYSNLTFSSPPFKLLIYLLNGTNEKLFKEGDVLSLYSGQMIDFRFVSYDQFNHISNGLDSLFMQLYLTIPEDQYILKNSKTIFRSSNATLFSFYIVCDPDHISKQPFELTVKIIDKNNIMSPIVSVPLFIQLMPCDIGHTVLNNLCVVCDGYSFVPHPTNQTICNNCPENAQCFNGETIIPKEGYWNFNENDTNILNCENNEACKVSCQEGYLGNVCHECQEHYGKTLMKQCIECDDNSTNGEIAQKIFKWLILFIITCYQTYLLQGYETNPEKMELYFATNVFIYHSNIVALTSNFHSESSRNLLNFYETQTVVTFLENNLKLLYCVFPNVRDESLTFLVFFYLLAIPLFQLTFLPFIYTICYFMKKKISYKNLKTIISLTFTNNFISVYYHFLGFVFYLTINGNNYSINFLEIKHFSSTFGIILALLFIGIFPSFLYSFYGFIKNMKSHSIIELFDSQYHHKLDKIAYYHFIILFFTMICSPYASLKFKFAFLVRGFFMDYLMILIILRPFPSNYIFLFKILSVVGIIVSFFETESTVILFNSLFYASFVCFVVKKTFILGKNYEN